jgi:hypothetical protein
MFIVAFVRPHLGHHRLRRVFSIIHRIEFSDGRLGSHLTPPFTTRYALESAWIDGSLRFHISNRSFGQDLSRSIEAPLPDQPGLLITVNFNRLPSNLDTPLHKHVPRIDRIISPIKNPSKKEK